MQLSVPTLLHACVWGDSVMKPKHSEFGGSSASRWMNCYGSTALLRTVPPMPESPYAAEGSAAHALAAHCLSNQERDASAHVGVSVIMLGAPPYLDVPITKEMAGAVQEYLDCAYAILDANPDAEFYVEKSFDIDIKAAPGEVYGQNDLCIYLPKTQKLVIIDYKHGIGVNVDATDNKQGQFYAVGEAFSHDWAISEVEVIIVQPRDWRNQYAETSVRRWTMDRADLFEFKERIESDIRRHKQIISALPKNRKVEDFKRGDWCGFCDAAVVCPVADHNFSKEVALPGNSIVGVKPSNLPDPDGLDPERIGAILEAGDVLQGWLAQVYARAEAMLLGGTPVPGWKVVDKQARAKITGEPEQIVGYLEMMLDLPADQVMVTKLDTLTNIEKAMKSAGADKKVTDEFRLRFTTKESSGRTIARASDRREGVDAIAADFKAVNTDAFKD